MGRVFWLPKPTFIFNMKAFKEVFTLVCLISAVLGNGEFAVHHSPNGINFKGNEPIDSSELPNILATAFGVSSNENDNRGWEGLTILNPFNYPKIAVIVEIEGFASLKLGENTYTLSAPTAISPQLSKAPLTFIPDSRVVSENDITIVEKTEDFKMEILSSADEVVAEFVKDLKLLNSLKQKVEGTIDADAVWIQLKGLNAIAQAFGQQSEQSQEAVTLLRNALEQLESSLEKVYGEKFLLASITEDNLHSRHTRAADKPDDIPKVKNLSKRYEEEYSAIFNIILFTSIFLIAALISTAVFICTLDPGRDSIIYRMTTQRIKKEN